MPLAARRPARLAAAWAEAGLDTAALLLFPLLVLLPRGTAALASVAGLCAAALVLSAPRTRRNPALASAAVLLACLVLWGAVSALWSVNPMRSLVMAARLAGLFAAGIALAAAAALVAAPRRLTGFVLSGLSIGIVLALIDLATAGRLSSLLSDHAFRATRLNQASISFAALLLPAGAVLISLGRPVCAVLLALATAATVSVLVGTAAKAVLIAGLPLGLALYRWRPQTTRVAAVLSVVAIVTAPLTFARLERLPGIVAHADAVKISAGHRLLIWSFAGDRIAEHPLKGWGLDSSRAIPGGEQPIRPGESWLPLHPHNAALQLWLELGVPGAVLFALLAALLWSGLAHAPWPPLFTAAAGAALTSALVSCFATYGIWQEWWLGTLSLSLFFVLVMARVASGAPAAPARRLQQKDRHPDQYEDDHGERVS